MGIKLGKETHTGGDKKAAFIEALSPYFKVIPKEQETSETKEKKTNE